MREKILKLLEETKIVAIIRGLTVEDAIKTAEALYKGGIKLVEVTFNQKRPDTFKETAAAISLIKEKLGDKIGVGAGTVITMEQLQIAKEAGAEFIVSPDTDEEIIKETVKLEMVSLPGAYTATEAKRAHNAGADYVKLFPCAENSATYVKALKAPLSHIKFLAVGGITPSNAKSFMEAGADGVGVGGSLVNKQWILEGKFDRIAEEARKLYINVNTTGDN